MEFLLSSYTPLEHPHLVNLNPEWYLLGIVWTILEKTRIESPGMSMLRSLSSGEYIENEH